jgi:hypothetical protein
MAPRREIPSKTHDLGQSSVLRSDCIAPAAGHLIVAKDDNMAFIRWMLQAVSERVRPSNPIDRLDPVRSIMKITPPTVLRQNPPHEFRLSRSTCASWINNNSHLFAFLSAISG